MENKEILEEKRIIAEFVELHEIMLENEIKYDGGDICEKLKVRIDPFKILTLSQLKFDTSWDWLMPVVEKIEDLMYLVEIKSENVIITHNYKAVVIIDGVRKGFNKKQATFKAVVEFIKWYNENK